MNRRIAFGVGAGMLGLAVDGVSGLLLYPVLLRNLGPEQAGLWMIMLSVAALMNLAQSSMAPTISRDIAQAMAVPSSLPGRISSASTIAALCSMCMLLLGLLLYPAYLGALFEKANLHAVAWSSWGLFSLGVAGFCHAQIHMFVLNGLGKVGIDKIVRAICVVLGFCAMWLSVHFTRDFRALAASYCLQNVVFMLACHFVFRRHVEQSVGRDAFTLGRLDYGLLKGGLRILVLNSSAYVLNNLAVFLAERNHGLEFVPKYTAMTRIGLLLAAISLLIPQMAFPYVARAWSERDTKLVRSYYVMGIAGATGAFLLASLAVLIAADWVFPLWLGNDNYLGKAYLATVLAYYFIYVCHVAQSQPVLAIGAADFLWCAILNAVAVALLMQYTDARLGIWSYPVALIAGTLPFSLYVASVGIRKILLECASQEST